MKVSLLILSCLAFFATGTPIVQNRTDVDIILDENLDYDFDFDCDPDLSAEHGFHKILSNINEYLQTIMFDAFQPHKDDSKVKCKNTTLENLHGVGIQGRPSAIISGAGIIDVTNRPLIPR